MLVDIKYLEVNQYKVSAKAITVSGSPSGGFNVNIDFFYNPYNNVERHSVYDLFTKASINDKVSKQLHIVYKQKDLATNVSEDIYFKEPTCLKFSIETNSEEVHQNVTLEFRCSDIEMLSDEAVDLID